MSSPNYYLCSVLIDAICIPTLYSVLLPPRQLKWDKGGIIYYKIDSLNVWKIDRLTSCFLCSLMLSEVQENGRL